MIVIRENTGSAVTPTEMLSMLKFFARNRFVIFHNIPGLFSTRIESIANISHHDGNIMSFSGVPGATNGNTSSRGSIGMSITVATSLFSPTLIAFSNSSSDCARIPCAPYDSAILI